MKISHAVVLFLIFCRPSFAQILVTSEAGASTENVERWLRRTRIPYLRAPGILNGRRNNRLELVVVAARQVDPILISRLRSFKRAVVVTETEGWNGSNGGVVVLSLTRMGSSDSERAEKLTSALLSGASIPVQLQSRLRNRWERWVQTLNAKRRKWLEEVSLKGFRDGQRKQRSLQLLSREVRSPSFVGTAEGSVWWERLRAILAEQRRIYQGLAISMEPQEGEVRGVWIHTYRPTDWDSVCSLLKENHFNALFFRASRGGNAVYPSSFLPMDPWAPSVGDELAQACAAAQRYGIELHAWRVHFHFGTAPDWFKEEMKKQGRLVRDPDGKLGWWLNPADPRNQEHELKAVAELSRYPIAGVHSDYIRYPETASYDFNPVSLSTFEKNIGKPITDFPRSVLNGLLNLRFRDFQRSVITNLVRRIRDTVKDVNPRLVYSAAVWTRHGYYYSVIYQDWVKWMNEGLLDFACPMNYTSDNTVLEERWAENLYDVMGKRPLVCGLGIYLLDDEYQSLEQIKLIRDYGCDGFLLFSYHVPFIRDCMKLLRLGPTSEPTYPCYQAPEIQIRISDGIRLPNRPMLYRAGDPVLVTLSIRPGFVEWKDGASLSTRVGWESPKTGRWEEIGQRQMRVSSNQTTGAHFRSLILPGRWRVVVYGSLDREGQAPVPFVVRGPFVQAVTSKEMEQTIRGLIANPELQKGRIGIIERSWGARQISEALARSGHRVYLVRSFSPAFWEKAEGLIIPPLKDLREMTYERCLLLRQWVEAGGRLLLLSEACGIRAHTNLFPEVALVSGEGPVPRRLRRSLNLPSGHWTWFLRPAGGRTVWASSPGAVVVEKRVGKGLVIMCGIRVPDEKVAEEWVGFHSLVRRLVARFTMKP